MAKTGISGHGLSRAVAVVIGCATLGAAVWAQGAVGAAGSGIDRPEEPIVIQYTAPVESTAVGTGAQGPGAATGERNYTLPDRILGIDPGDLVAFRFDGSWTQVPVQVDEREVMDLNRIYGPGYPSCSDPCYTKPPAGARHIEYTDPNTWVGADTDGTLDADDEVALMASEAGGEAGPEAPAGVDPASAVEVEVTDPLEAGATGYVYLFENTTDLDPGAGADDIEYHFEIADGKPYKSPTGSYRTDASGSANAPNMGRGGASNAGRPENSYVETDNYRRGFSDRWKDDELRVFKGGATGEDILDRHDAQFDALDASCVRTQTTYAQGEGAFVANRTGPVRAIRDFIGANSGPHVQRQHIFYDSKETIHTFLRVHPVPGVTDFFDYSQAAATAGTTYANGAVVGGVPVALNEGVPIDGTQDAIVPAAGASGIDGWEAVTGPAGGVVMPQAFITNNADPSYHLNYRDGSLLGPNPCNGDDDLFGASGPQGNSAFENTDEAQRTMWGGGLFKNLYYRRSLFFEAPGVVDGDRGNARLNEELNPLELAFEDPGLGPPAPNPPPTARFTYDPGAPQTGQQVDFDGSTSTDDGTITGYEWDLDGDGAFDDSTSATPSHTYGSAATYPVGLRVSDDDGATDTFTQNVVVTDAPNQNPNASFTFSPASPTTGQQVAFDASASSDPDGTIATYAWDLDGDGQFDDATGSTTVTTFGTAGGHVVSLRVTDDDGGVSTQSKTVVVDGPPANQPPDAAFTASPVVALVGETIDLDASDSSDSDGTITTYDWDLDDDGQFDDATGVTTTTSFASAGTHRIKLRVTDDDAAGDTASQQVVVNDPPNQAPDASFTYAPASPEVGQQVDFDGGGSSDPDGSIATYEWDLDGDGAFDDATGETTDNTYNAARTGTVGLKVTDGGGATDTSVQSLTVTDPNLAPTASFDHAPSDPVTGQTVSFASSSADSDGSIVGYEWDLDDDGDFDDSSSAATDRSFDSPGFHNVRLRVTDDDGASATASESIEVAPAPPGATPAVSPPMPPTPATPRFCRGVPATHEAEPGVVLRGTSGTDVMVGTPGDDVLIGGNGKDLICGQGGDDRLIGGNGPDIVLGNRGDDLIKGGRGADLLSGNKDDDRLLGNRGRDTLGGGTGDDRVGGGKGRDLCSGGPGRNKLRGCE